MNMHANAAPGADAIRPPRYLTLPEQFYAQATLSPVSAPRLLRLNEELAAELGLDAGFLRSADGVAMLAGNVPARNVTPVALAYAGHQFGNFVPQLGDGRAMLIGEALDRAGRPFEIHLKGSGQTPFSRGGDGRAAIGPVLREYIVSEAMAALGIPTTRTLAAVATGDRVYRDALLPGAVLARVAASHMRIGTFQYFAARRDVESLRLLTDHAIARLHPHAADAERPALALLESVIAAQAELVARWMLVGFIHGVMNTDNMTISGETIDYGPCAFMDTHRAGQVFSSIDRAGRYAYANQPRIAAWNLTRFAETLLPLIDTDEAAAIAAAEGALRGFQGAYDRVFHHGLRRKIGLATERDGDLELVSRLFQVMEGAADFTLLFRTLSEEVAEPAALRTRALFGDPAPFDAWERDWRARLAQEHHHDADRSRAMKAVNPRYIPRNHRIEAVIASAVYDDMRPFEELLSVVTRPFDDQPGRDDYALPPRPEEVVTQTFCGT